MTAQRTDEITGLWANPLVRRAPHLLTAAAALAWWVASLPALLLMLDAPGLRGWGLLVFGLTVLLSTAVFGYVVFEGENPLGALTDSIAPAFVAATGAHLILIGTLMPWWYVGPYALYVAGYFWYPRVYARATRQTALTPNPWFRSSRTRATDKFDAYLRTEVFADQHIWGTPGANIAGAADAFGVGAAEQGALGERYGARALEALLEVYPDAFVFHSLAFPGSAVADVDHALVIGNHVILVDSKAWRPGTYSWDHHGAILRDGEYFKGGDNHMSVAVEGYYDELAELPKPSGFPDNPRVTGIILLTQTAPGQVFDVDNTLASRKVLLSGPDQLVETVGEFLIRYPESDNPATGVVLGHLRDRLK